MLTYSTQKKKKKGKLYRPDCNLTTQDPSAHVNILMTNRCSTKCVSTLLFVFTTNTESFHSFRGDFKNGFI